MQTSARDRKSGAIEAQRIPFERPVEVRNPLGLGHVIRSTANISMTGMFVKTDDPHPVGTTFSFSCRLDDHRPFEGIAEVRWTRDRDDDVGRPAGMGVRFLELDDTSARAVRWLVEKTLHDARRRSGSPGETIAAAPESAGEADRGPVEDPLPAPSSQSSPWGASADWRQEIRQRRKRRRSLQLVAALILIVALIALWITAPRIQSLGRIAGPAGNDATAEVPQAVATERAAPAPVRPAPGGGPDPLQGDSTEASVARQADYTAEIEVFIDTWLAAWTGQEVDDYLACYGAAFSPEGLERSAWEEQRRARISSPGFILVRLTGVNIQVPPGRATSPPSARVTFVQAYRSNTFRDTVLKTLDLIREEGRWTIAGETSEIIEI